MISLELLEKAMLVDKECPTLPVRLWIPCLVRRLLLAVFLACSVVFKPIFSARYPEPKGVC